MAADGFRVKYRPSSIARRAALKAAPKIARAIATAKADSTKLTSVFNAPRVAQLATTTTTTTAAAAAGTTATGPTSAAKKATRPTSSSSSSAPKKPTNANKKVAASTTTNVSTQPKRPVASAKKQTTTTAAARSGSSSSSNEKKKKKKSSSSSEEMCLQCGERPQNYPHYYCSRRCGIRYEKLAASGQVAQPPPPRRILALPVANYKQRSAYQALAEELVRLLLPAAIPPANAIRQVALANAAAEATAAAAATAASSSSWSDDGTTSSTTSGLTTRMAVSIPLVPTGLTALLLDIIADYACETNKEWREGELVDVYIPVTMFYPNTAPGDSHIWREGRIKSLGYDQITISVEWDDSFLREHRLKNRCYSQKVGYLQTDFYLAPWSTHFQRGKPNDYPCFSGDVMVMMADDSWKPFDQLQAGDQVMSPIIASGDEQSSCEAPQGMAISTIEQVHQSRVLHMFEMVNYHDMWITPGHPLYIPAPLPLPPRCNTTTTAATIDDHSTTAASSSSSSSCCSVGHYDWYRPDEVARIELRQIDSVFNLQLNSNHHTIIVRSPNYDDNNGSENVPPAAVAGIRVGVGGVIACTLGRDCGGRLRRLHPHNDTKYGAASSLSP